MPAATGSILTLTDGLASLLGGGTSNTTESVDGHDLTDFTKWVIDELIFPLNTVRSLPRILSNAKAKEIFLREGAEAAIRSLQAESEVPSLSNVSLPQLINEMLNRLATIPFQQVQRMRENARDTCRESLIDLKDSLDDIVTHVTEGRDD